MATSKNFFLNPRTKPIIIAHRGASGEAPENTMASFKLAVQQQADAIELDVQRTKDGRLVIMHDNTLGRTAKGHGKISSKTLHYLERIDAGSWFDPAFSQERIPSLGHVLDTFGTKTQYVVELKFYSMVLSFSSRILDAIKQRDENTVTCLALVPHAPLTRARAARRHDVIATSVHSRWLHGRIGKRDQPINTWIGSGKPAQIPKRRTDMITTNYPADTRALLG
jgi:hypothetical protein